MNICYLTWGETPRSYGVFGSQVIRQFVETKKTMRNSQFFFVSGLPVIHSGLVREKLGYRQELEKVKDSLVDVSFKIIPILVSQNFVNSTKNTFGFLHGLSHSKLNIYFNEIKPDVVHCRSYHAAWAALCVKNKFNHSYKIVFDGRGIWPFEVALKRNWDESNKNLLFLKEIEKKLLKECDISIGVSKQMTEFYDSLGAKKVDCVYLSSDTKRLKPKNKPNINKEVTFCYVGALSEGTWHKIHTLKGLYKKLRNLGFKTKIIIATTSDHEEIKKQFAVFPDEEVELTAFKDLKGLREILHKSDFGLMSYYTATTEREIFQANMVLAIKTVEYLSAGLPMIVNKQCGGASEIVRKHNMGIPYTPNDYSEVTAEKIEYYLNPELKTRISDVTDSLFDYKNNAKKYRSIYESL